MSSDYFSDLQSQASKESNDSYILPTSSSPLSEDSARDIDPKLGSDSAHLSSDEDTRNAEGEMSPMDPRRLTPTLQASLVSEILTLRREIESRNRVIDDLESNVDTLKSENETLSEKIIQGVNESRIADQRFQTLERGTREAVEDLLRERDEANNSNSKTKVKLRALLKTTKDLEDRATEVQSAQEREKQTWENERRRLEMLLHASETRVATLVKHLEIQQMAADGQAMHSGSEWDDLMLKNRGDADDSDEGSGMRTPRPFGHRRGQSSISTIRSVARSIDSPRKYAAPKALAEELESEEEDDYDLDDFEHNDDELFSDSRLGLSDSRLGHVSGRTSTAGAGLKAKKILGLTDEMGTSFTRTGTPVGSLASTRPSSGSSMTSGAESAQSFAQARRITISRYSNTAMQPSWITPAPAHDKGTENHEPGTEASASRVNDENPRMYNTSNPARDDTQWPDRKSSHGVPQSFGLMSPPETPVCEGPRCQGCTTTEPGSSETRYRSCATQTDHLQSARGDSGPEAKHDVVSQHLPIPCISIQPPTSAASSLGQPVLPPGTAHRSTQTDRGLLSGCCDASVQTDEIRIDQRPVKLPPHLLPSTLESALDRVEQKFRDSTMPESARSQVGQGPPTGRRNSTRQILKAINLPRPVLRATEDEEKCQDQDVSSVGIEDVLIRAGHLSILSSGSNWASWRELYDEAAREAKREAGRPENSGQSGSLPTKVVPRSTCESMPNTASEDHRTGHARHPSQAKPANVSSKLFRKNPAAELESGNIPGDPSRMDLPEMDLGRAYHVALAERNDSRLGRPNDGLTQPPPFPIPGRSSSFNPGSGSSTTSGQTISSGRSDLGSPQVKRTARRVRSSSTVRASSKSLSKRRRRAAHLSPIQSMAFDGTITIDRAPQSAPVKQKSMPTMEVAPETAPSNIMHDDGPFGEQSDNEGVLVDAIATAMVGDWLWKYVRRKKSFGIGDSAPGDDFMHGAVRHRRWVWLSPYERTVMWSSRQPTSEGALMGRHGRKLTIKSVLDVKDITPLPKSMLGEEIFDRSILVLTPERALKFTAPTMERHYLWLSALSFLADTGRGPPGIPRGPAWVANDQPKKSPLDRARGIPPTPTLSGSIFDESFQPQPMNCSRRLTTTTESEISPWARPQSSKKHFRERSLTSPAQPSSSISSTFRSLSSSISPLNQSSSRSNFHKQVPAIHVPGSGGISAGHEEKETSRPLEPLNPLRMNAFVRSDWVHQNGMPYLPTPPASAKAKHHDIGRDGARRPSASYGEERRAEDRRVGFVLWEKNKDLFTSFG